MTAIEAEELVLFFTREFSSFKEDFKITLMRDVWHESSITEKTIVKNAVNMHKYGRK